MGTKNRNVAAEALRFFLSPGEAERDLEKFDQAIGSLDGDLKEVGGAFQKNLEACISTGSIPVLIAGQSAVDFRFNQILQAKRLETKADAIGTDKEHPTEWLSGEQELEAHEAARAELEQGFAERTGQNAVADHAASLLLKLREYQPLADAASELLR